MRHFTDIFSRLLKLYYTYLYIPACLPRTARHSTALSDISDLPTPGTARHSAPLSEIPVYSGLPTPGGTARHGTALSDVSSPDPISRNRIRLDVSILYLFSEQLHLATASGTPLKSFQELVD